jgi:spermidine synthase/MFS family permease
MKPTTRLIAALLFGSGFSALVYQTAWQRMLRLVFGASTAASSAVLGIFLGGLGLGGFLFGRRAEKRERPLLLYGQLELGVAICSALTPFLVEGAAFVYFHAGGSRTLGIAGATIVRLVLATLVMGPSVVLMGGTLPAAARAVEHERDSARSNLAVIYAVNTSGAVLGALLPTFVLFEVFGTRVTLWLACLVNLLVAMTARAVGREAEPIPNEAPFGDARRMADQPPGLPPSLVYAAAGIVGFAFACLELVWYRMLAPLLGGSSFTFGLVLGVALAGIGIGGFIYARRDPARGAEPSLLALTIGLEALAAGFPLWVGDDIAVFSAFVQGLRGLGFGPLVVGWSLSTAVVVLPAAVVAGYQFPAIIALLGRGRRNVARQVGFGYAFNTMGSIAGALLGGFVLLPLIGAASCWRAVVWLLAAVALLALAFSWWCERSGRVVSRAVVAAVVVLSGVCALSKGPSAVWRHAEIGAGRAAVDLHMAANDMRRWATERQANIVWEKDGVESSLGVENSNGHSFVVNGKSDGNVVFDRGTQVMLSVLPAMLHPEPRSVFVLGLGTGMSAGWAAKIPSVELVDVAEIEPAMTHVARMAAAANQHALDNPKLYLFQGDGREFLLTSSRTYDVIVSEPSNPFRAGIASLFTREYYQTAARRLAAGGIFAQWLQAYEVDAHAIRLTFATLLSVFPVVEAWQTEAGDLLLVASREPIVHDVARLRRRLAQEPYLSAVRRSWLVEDAEGVFAHYVAAPELVREIAGAHAGDLNTDDVNALEFAFARTIGRSDYTPNVELIELGHRRGSHRPRLSEQIDWSRVDEQRGRAWLTVNAAPPRLPMSDPTREQHAALVASACLGDIAGASEKLEPDDGALWARDVIEQFALAEVLAYRRDPRCLDSAKRLHSLGFAAEAGIVAALYATRTGQPSSVELAIRTLEYLRTRALPLCATAKTTIEVLEAVATGDPGLAHRAAEALLAAPLAVGLAERQRIDAAQRLAFATPDIALCLRALGDEIERPRWRGPVLLNRERCLSAAGDPRASEAKRDVQAFLRGAPGSLGDGLPAAPAVPR